MDDYKRSLIECVKERPLLWDPMDPYYKNKEERRLAWEDIEDHLKGPAGLKMCAKETWSHLSRGFSNALRRRNKRSSENDTSTAVSDFEVEWRFEKDMVFLLPAKQLRSFTSGHSILPIPISSMETDSMKSVHSGDEGSCNSHSQSERIGKTEIDLDTSREDVEDFGDHDNIGSGRESSCSPDTMGTFTSAASTTSSSRLPSKKRKLEMTGVDDCDRDKSTRINNMDRRRQPPATPMPVEDSPRWGFFMSLMPMVDSLDDDQFMDFQMDIIQAMKKRRQAAGRKQQNNPDS